MNLRVWLGFFALCLLNGSAWLFDQRFPVALGGLPRLATHGAILALLFWVVSMLRRSASWPRRAEFARISLGAAGMIAVPEIVSVLAGGKVSELTQVLLFMLIPVVVLLTSAQTATAFGA